MEGQTSSIFPEMRFGKLESRTFTVAPKLQRNTSKFSCLSLLSPPQGYEPTQIIIKKERPPLKKKISIGTSMLI